MTKHSFLAILILFGTIHIAFAQCCKYDINGNRQGYWMYAEMQNEEHYGVVPYDYAIGKYIDDKKSGIWYYYNTLGLLVQSELYNNKDTVLIKIYHPNNKIKVEGKAYLQDDIHIDFVENPITGDIDTVKLIGPPTKSRCGKWKHYSINGKLEKVINY